MSKALKDLYSSKKIIDGYKVIELANQKAILIEGEYTKIIPLKNDLKKIYLEVTAQCNFDCITCIRNSWDEELGNMSDNVFNNLLMSLEELEQITTIHLGGFGEPLSHPNILTMIKKLKEQGLKVEMITNGALLTPEVSQQLVTLGLDYIYVSIDSTVAENYGDIRKGGNYNQVIQNITELNKLRLNNYPLRPELGIEFVAMQSNFNDIPNLMQLAKSLKATKVLVSNVLPYNEEMYEERLYDFEDKDFPFGIESVHAYIANMKLRSHRSCKFVENNSVAINWQGEVAPCYALMHSYKCFIYDREKAIKAYSFGNVRCEKLLEIWQKPSYVNFRHRVKEKKFPSCTDCKWLDGCSYTQDNAADCWGNEPSCADCLWYREIIICP